MQSQEPLSIRDGYLNENWYIACLSPELSGKKPIQRVIYDQPLVLFRSSDGKPHCLPDRCLHRHAQLSCGVILSGKLACPYHGWVYDGDGYVIEVPSEGPQNGRKGGRDSSELKLPARPCIEQDGCVWVWMGKQLPVTSVPPFRFPYRGDQPWVSYFMITDFDNEVTHLAENFMDVPHTVFVHARWFRKSKSKRVPIRVETNLGTVLVTYEQPTDEIGFTGRILNPKNEPMVHTDLFVLPNLTRVDYVFGKTSAFLIVSQCTPVSTLKSRVYTYIAYRFPGRFLVHGLKPFFRFYTRQVIEQDVKIMANQGASFRNDPRCDFHSTDADAIHREIEKLRAWAVQGDSQALTYRFLCEKEIWL